MNEKAPPGCVTCYVALNEIIKPERPAGYFPKQWEVAFVGGFGSPVDGLDDFDFLRMIRTAQELRRQLSHEEQVACYAASDWELADLGPLSFDNELANENLVKGLASFEGKEVEIFIREASCRPSQTHSREVAEGAKPSKIADRILHSLDGKGADLSKRRRPTSIKSQREGWLAYVQSFPSDEKPNRDERRAQYAELGLSQSEGNKLHMELSPPHWKSRKGKKKNRKM
jgi:hypothetical protein